MNYVHLSKIKCEHLYMALFQTSLNTVEVRFIEVVIIRGCNVFVFQLGGALFKRLVDVVRIEIFRGHAAGNSWEEERGNKERSSWAPQ